MKINRNIQPKVCVIGAGPSGITAIKNLQEQGLTKITAYEKSYQIGGNWVFNEGGTHSSVYETTHLISSKRLSEFEDFPMPGDYPDYPSHSQVLKYFNAYVAHFDLCKHIVFNTTVLGVTRTYDQKWKVDFDSGAGVRQEFYDYLLIANGHHWDPMIPDFPGTFTGEFLHSHQYKKAAGFKNKRVLVVGGGNSACDLAVEISRVSLKTSISMRRGCNIFPKFIFGKPTDIAAEKIKWMPAWLRNLVIGFVIRCLQGRYSKYQLMNPDCGPLEIHPTINSELLYFIRHGKIKPRPGISQLEGKRVYFLDGCHDEFDSIICATGYKISFPFFERSFLDFDNESVIPLYQKMMHPEHESLYFIGLCQPQGCIWPLADLQSKIAARIIAGSLNRPAQIQTRLAKEISKQQACFKSDPRHALEVDYHSFRQELLDTLKI